MILQVGLQATKHLQLEVCLLVFICQSSRLLIPKNSQIVNEGWEVNAILTSFGIQNVLFGVAFTTPTVKRLQLTLTHWIICPTKIWPKKEECHGSNKSERRVIPIFHSLILVSNPDVGRYEAGSYLCLEQSKALGLARLPHRFHGTSLQPSASLPAIFLDLWSKIYVTSLINQSLFMVAWFSCLLTTVLVCSSKLVYTKLKIRVHHAIDKFFDATLLEIWADRSIFQYLIPFLKLAGPCFNPQLG